MQNEFYVFNILRNILPPMSKILLLQEPYNLPAILTPDLDGDGLCEIIVGYEWQCEKYVIALKNFNNYWYSVANLKGDWYNITSYWYYLSNPYHETPPIFQER